MPDPSFQAVTLVSPRRMALRAVLDRLPEPAATRSVLKRGLDVCAAVVLLALTAPLILAAAALVRLTSPGAPALFAQPRIGHRGKPFRMFKIRTMVPGAERLESSLHGDTEIFFKPANDPRITRVGRILRKYSIDELPQLWNVLLGEMSLVGPRPILLSDFDRMPVRQQLERFAVRPGMTGLWQVSGRSRLSDRERMRLDLEYVHNWCLAMDLRILLRTIPAVARAEGAT